MTPERRGKQKRGRARQPVNLPDLRSFGIYEPVILVVDDDVLVRNLVMILMQDEGYFVLSASDGYEGLELSRKYPGPIDIVITDVAMPRLNGSRLHARLLEERPGIQVLMMSEAEVSGRASQTANLPFLPNPVDGQVLRAKVRALLAELHKPAMDEPGAASHAGEPPE